MANIVPPKYVRHILFELQARGYPAYLVGGCVRDIILGVRPNDWDICTGALPEQVLELFPGSRPTGLKHGTVTVVKDSHQVEVTTFRSEGRYLDHRRPEEVHFVGELTTDLARRDFTMNAMAISPDGVITDPFGGREDIEKKIIRCVGEPETRFEEDALRMFRAFRFSSRLAFSIEGETLSAIFNKSHLASALAAERVRDELEKLLLSKSPATISLLIRTGLMEKYLLRSGDAPGDMELIGRLPRKPMERWGALCHLLMAKGYISSTEEFLTQLRLDGRSIRCCSAAEPLIGQPSPRGAEQWKNQLRRYGVDTVSCAARCRDAIYGGSSYQALRKVLKSGECFSVKHLAVDGDDLVSLGYVGRELGDMLNFLLDYVIEFPENNRRELLLALAGSMEE